MGARFEVGDYSGDSTLGDQAGHAADATFLGRLGVAIAHQALRVQGEDPATGYHVRRSDLAFAVLMDPAGSRARFAWAVVADGSTGPASTDWDLLGRVGTVWDAVAGVGAEPLP